ncbi:Filament-like plant protein 3 [Linum perenne]
MEKRNWLWKKKPSDKGAGESESSGGGSISSHSERFSDDQEALKASPHDDSQSPEVTSKSSAGDEEVNDNNKCLKEKLVAALVNMSEKDGLVKQHSKVAEEAVAGWEKAENEVEVLKKQLEAATKQKSILEDRVSHVDGALKECVRQLRQAQEEQEVKIHEAVANNTNEWESIKSKLEQQIFELKTEAAKSKSLTQVDPELYHRLEYLEEENESMRLELLSQSEELEVRTIERDLSTQAAETASKQNLESIKKLAKLKAECRRLKAAACRSASSPLNDHKISAASSIYLESLTDSNSDGGERLNALETPNRNLPASAVATNLMDDFLEMERLAAMPETGSRSSNRVKSEGGVKQFSDAESLSKVELEMAIRQIAELEFKLNELQEANDELGQSLENMKEEKAEVKLSLERMTAEKAQVERWLEEMEAEKGEVESSLERMIAEKAQVERWLEEMEAEKGEVELCVEKMIAEKAQMERSLEEMEAEKGEVELCLEKMMAEKAQVERSLEEMEAEKGEVELCLKKMLAEKAQVERSLEEMEEEKTQLETSLTRSEDRKRASESRLREVEHELEEVQTRLSSIEESKQDIEFQFIGLEAECRALSAEVVNLESELEKERATSMEFSIKFQYMEKELARMQEEFEYQQSISLNSAPKIKQEDLALAAGKLAECQNTILSLGNQLKSLATIEDFLIDSSIPEIEISVGNSSLSPGGSGELWKLHSNGTYSPKLDSSSSRVAIGSPSASPIKHGRSSPSSSSSTSSAVHNTSSDKNRNGFANFFSRSKNGIQLEL